jgi:cytoskeletal protein RodZ
MSSGLSIKYKKSFSMLKWLASVLVVGLLLVAGWYAYQWFVYGDEPPLVPLPASALADPSVDETPVTPAMVSSHTVPATHPRYISIPSLGIEKARVQNIGLTKNNILDTPKNISDTAWYNKSATPGQGYGSVLIDGHNGGVSRDGVFAGLERLVNDDEIIIERGDGKLFTYKVVENKTESLQDANTTGMQRLMTPFESSKEGLGLVTCAGKWVPRDKVFDKRIMIRAVASD